jgi:RNA polymerase sigma factor (sigma-70 family)
LTEYKNIRDNSSYKGMVSDPEKFRILVQNCIAQDRKAQKQLYELYATHAYNVIKRYVFRDEAAQEILNDCFYKIFTRIGQYSYEGVFEAWMGRIIVNTITDYLRKHIKYEKEGKEEVQEDDAFVDSNAVSNMSFKELVRFTYELPDMHRAVFNLYIFENLIHKDIGKLLNISEGNSRWILNDARKRLKQIITNSMR